MSKSVILALSPFAVVCVICTVGVVLLPIETRGRALLVNIDLFAHKVFKHCKVAGFSSKEFVSNYKLILLIQILMGLFLLILFSKMHEIHPRKMKESCTFVKTT